MNEYFISNILVPSVSGVLTGAVLTFTTSGLLCVYGFDNGWPTIFYIHGNVLTMYLSHWLKLLGIKQNMHEECTHAYVSTDVVRS